jgi:hypothetical protein
VASPELVVATTIAGDIGFDPERDTIPLPNGKQFKFTAPYGKELPPKGFDPGEDTFQVGGGRSSAAMLLGDLTRLAWLGACWRCSAAACAEECAPCSRVCKFNCFASVHD